MYINYETDTLYLNRKLSSNGGKCRDPALVTAGKIYADWLKPVRRLAVNLNEMNALTFVIQRWKARHVGNASRVVSRSPDIGHREEWICGV